MHDIDHHTEKQGDKFYIGPLCQPLVPRVSPCLSGADIPGVHLTLHFSLSNSNITFLTIFSHLPATYLMSAYIESLDEMQNNSIPFSLNPQSLFRFI